MLPYINLADKSIGPIHWFGVLVALGVIIGIWLARKRAPLFGLSPNKLESFINWMLAGGFIGAHVLDVIFYHPEELSTRPWGLLFIWESLSSFGGFVGAAAGMFLWKKFRNDGKPILVYVELIASVFPISWIFGRMGCALVHDHKGRMAAEPNIFTVAFPDGPHYDLGTLEMFFAVFISLILVVMWRKPRPIGTYIGVVLTLYAPVRFGLDFLRLESGPTGDPRYLMLTPAQWACVATFVFGLFMLVKSVRSPRPSEA